MNGSPASNLQPPTSNVRVVVALSGGVDSSVAAALLKEQGYDVVGLMLKLWSAGESGKANRCCTPADVDAARAVADQLGIPFYLINVADSFKATVVDYFIDEYTAGRTPNPCLMCNRHIRYELLLNKALSLGAHYLVPLVLGIVLMDFGAHGTQITNQSEIYRLSPSARSRLTTAYMTAYFAGTMNTTTRMGFSGKQTA